MATIQIKRANATGAVTAPVGADGELVFAQGGFAGNPLHGSAGNDLMISHANSNRILIGPGRQVELIGAQTITGVKTIDVLNLRLLGGNADEALHTDGAGNLRWSPSGTGGAITQVDHDASMVGNGTSVSPLGLNPATNAQIATGADNLHAISAAGLRSQMGDSAANLATSAKLVVPAINETFALASGALQNVAHDASMLGNGHPGANQLTLNPATTLQINAATPDNIHAISPLGLRGQMGVAVPNLLTAAKTVVPAINELNALVRVLEGAMTFIGAYDVPNNVVIPGTGGPYPGGALPQAVPANRGWYTIVEFEGTGIGHAPGVFIDVGDWLISDGATWLHFAMHYARVLAGSVYLAPAIPGMPGTSSVQEALEYIETNMLQQVFVDGTSITGDGSSAATSLRVGVVDGGVF